MIIAVRNILHLTLQSLTVTKRSVQKEVHCYHQVHLAIQKNRTAEIKNRNINN